MMMWFLLLLCMCMLEKFVIMLGVRYCVGLWILYSNCFLYVVLVMRLLVVVILVMSIELFLFILLMGKFSCVRLGMFLMLGLVK